MIPEVLVKRSLINAPAEEVFRWHARPGAFERLNPPWNPVTVLDRSGTIKDGDRVTIANKIGPLSIKWNIEHRDYVDGRQFRDVQVRGPFQHWEHLHLVEPDGPGRSYLEDRVEYTLPFGTLGAALMSSQVRKQLERVFEYRHRILAADVEAHGKQTRSKVMKVLVTGSSGLIGSALIPFLTAGGHQVVRLVRSGTVSENGRVLWNPDAGIIDADRLEGLDAVVHLAGENISSGRWTKEKKARIRESRVVGTRLLSEKLVSLERPPKVVVAASAVGFYGDRSDELLSEESPAGTGFLSEVVQDWEMAATPASEAGIRVVNLRFGVVLSPAGGALAKMKLPFSLGAGGPIGNGKQYLSWIALDDAIGAIYHAINTDVLAGPVNAATGDPVTNRQFSRTLGRVLGRPAIFPMPAVAARLAFGEMAEQTLLASTRVAPVKLQATGYEFRFPDLEGALRHLLGKARAA